MQVVFPGVLGLTDEEIGYSNPRPTSAHKRSKSTPPRKHAAHTLANDSKLADNSTSPATTTKSHTSSTWAVENGVDLKIEISRGNHGLTSKGPSSCGGFTTENGRRTTYLGREQKFPLRRVESHLAAGDRGFGLSGVADNSPGKS